MPHILQHPGPEHVAFSLTCQNFLLKTPYFKPCCLLCFRDSTLGLGLNTGRCVNPYTTPGMRLGAFPLCSYPYVSHPDFYWPCSCRQWLLQDRNSALFAKILLHQWLTLGDITEISDKWRTNQSSTNSYLKATYISLLQIISLESLNSWVSHPFNKYFKNILYE